MLYIASALSPTPILDTLRVQGLTSADTQSLVVAKPDKVELWNINETGLTWTAELGLWGSIAGISVVQSQTLSGVKPHILVVLGSPNAQLLLLAYQAEPAPALIVTSSLPLSPPTPHLRSAEFFTGVITHGLTALVSLWTGVLSCVEIDVEKNKDAKRRRSSTAATDREQRLVFKDDFNINVREHNLLHLSFLPSQGDEEEPRLSYLWMPSSSTPAEGRVYLQIRRLVVKSRSLNEVGTPIDVVTPGRNVAIEEDTDFSEIAFSCPAARYVLPVSSEHVLVIGDEYTCLYSFTLAPQSPRVARASLSSSQGPKSPRAASHRSPQNELTGSTGKRRKSSMASQKGGLDGGERWELRPVWRERQGYGTVLSAAVIEAHQSGGHALIGDENGRLTSLIWEFERDQNSPGSSHRGSVSVRMIVMGVVAPPSSLTYLDNSHLFLSSACGDSSLIELHLPSASTSVGCPSSPTGRSIPIRKGKGRASMSEESGAWTVLHDDSLSGSVTLRERWMNLAPVRDFDVVREEGGGVSHLVVASGASNTNSLRVIRSGVGLEDTISIEGLDGITDLWPLPQKNGSNTLLGSTATSTFMLQLEPEISVLSVPDKITRVPTAAAGMNEFGFVQISPQGAYLWSDLQSGNPAGLWNVLEGEEVVAAQIDGILAVIARRNGKVDILEATRSDLRLVVSCDIGAEVSAVAIIRLPTLPSPIVAVATWTNELLLYTLDHLQTSSPVVTDLKESYFASSLLLKPSCDSSTSTSGVQLVAGLSDGSMITYDLEPSGDQGQVVVKGRRVSSLGTRPLKLCPINSLSSGEENVVAVGLTERMSIVFESRDRIDFSTASRKDIVAAVDVSSPSLGNTLVLASPSGLSFTKVNLLKKLSVQTMDTGSRTTNKLISLTHQPLLATGSTSRISDSQTGDILQTSYFELRDQPTLESCAELTLKDREEVTCLQEVLLMGRHYIAVGTSVYPSDDQVDALTSINESSVYAKTGRLLLISANNEADTWRLEVIHSQETIGTVHDIAVIHGFLAVTAASTLYIYKFSPNGPSFEEMDSYSSTFVAQHLLVVPPTKLHSTPRLVIGDAMRSVSLVEVDEENGALYPEIKDLTTHQVVALQSIKDSGEGCIIADGHSNLLTFRVDDSVEGAASFGLHEDVARFRQGSLVPPSSAPETMTPDLLFATEDGRIGIIGELTAAASQTMNDLQRNMAKYHRGPGGADWKTWRRAGIPTNPKDTAGFIDGDFIQRFLNTSLIATSDTEKVLSGTNPHERVSRLAPGGADRVDAEKADVVRVLEAAAGLY